MISKAGLYLCLLAITIDIPRCFNNEFDIRSGIQKNDVTFMSPVEKNQKCNKQSIILTKQLLVYEISQINGYNLIWFNDLDKEELIEEQKQSLASIIMSGLNSQQFLTIDGQAMFEIEASYFRPTQQFKTIPINIMRRHQNKCYLDKEKGQYNYIFGISLGPFVHRLDLLYRVPKEFRLSQPIDWRYAQVSLLVPRMSYEVTLKQDAQYNLASTNGCPLEISDVTYFSSIRPQIEIQTEGLIASSNQTLAHLERFFNDYTRPTISNRIRQMLKFQLNTKTFPLSEQK